MVSKIVIDACLFSRPDLNWLDHIKNETKLNDIKLVMTNINEKGGIHQKELVTIISAGCAVAALIVAIIKLMKDQEEEWTYKKLLDECHAFLQLHGIRDYTIEYHVGFENLVHNNGKPCIVKIRTQQNEPVFLNIGKTREMIMITPKNYDHRSLLS